MNVGDRCGRGTRGAFGGEFPSQLARYPCNHIWDAEAAPKWTDIGQIDNHNLRKGAKLGKWDRVSYVPFYSLCREIYLPDI